MLFSLSREERVEERVDFKASFHELCYTYSGKGIRIFHLMKV